MTTNTKRPKPIRTIVDNMPCWFNERTYSEGWGKIRPERICPICNQPMCVGDSMYMVINNYQLFPNTLIHQSCAKDSLKDTTLYLASQFKLFEEELKALIDKNKEWARVSKYVAE